MKKTLIILTIAISSCDANPDNVITGKRYLDNTSCLCSFYYDTNGHFEDSCSRYNVGDKANKYSK